MGNTDELTFSNCKTLILDMDTEQLDELIHTVKYRRDEINRELKIEKAINKALLKLEEINF